MHTRDLRYFLAVAEHQHVTRAAGSLFITQPALSKQIAGLERTLGARLFDRRPDGVRLTAAGERLLPHAREIVRLSEAAFRDVTAAAGSATKLTIGFWLSPPTQVLREVVPSFGARHPDLRLRLRRADWSEVGAGVESGEADVGIVHAPRGRRTPGLRSHRLTSEDLSVAVPRDHPFAGRGAVDPQELAGETLFVLPPQAGRVAGACYLPSGDVRAKEYVTSIDETNEAVAAGLGVCVETDSIARGHPHPGVVTVPLAGGRGADCLLVWREAGERRPEVRTLVEVLVQAHTAWFAAGRPVATAS